MIHWSRDASYLGPFRLNMRGGTPNLYCSTFITLWIKVAGSYKSLTYEFMPHQLLLMSFRTALKSRTKWIRKKWRPAGHKKCYLNNRIRTLTFDNFIEINDSRFSRLPSRGSLHELIILATTRILINDANSIKDVFVWLSLALNFYFSF